jgi:hypothetical protein
VANAKASTARAAPSGSRSHQNGVEAAERSADVDTQPTSTLLFQAGTEAADPQPAGTAGEQPRLDDEEHAAGGGVKRERPEANRVVGHGHSGR